MDPSVVLSAFTLLFLAEMGDKTQLVAMTLAHRYRALPVAAGACSAFLVLNLLAVWVGQVLFLYVPQRLVLIAAGLLFLIFAYRSWRDAADGDGPGDVSAGGGGRAFASSFALIFVAELGDKTQLALIALVAATGAPWAVFTGGTLALWAVTLIGIALGATLLRRVPHAWMHRAAAALFLVFGLLAVGEAVLGDARMAAP